MQMDGACPFCSLPPEKLLAANAGAAAFLDVHPAAEGHALVIPNRHVASLFDLKEPERAEIWEFVRMVCQILVERFHPDGFTIYLNDEEAADQAVVHAHIHVVPRHKNQIDPRSPDQALALSAPHA
jgi:diadenosine tetraphosphate (Ap4A) HIT family hydrolase